MNVNIEHKVNGFIYIRKTRLICGVYRGSHFLLEYWFIEKASSLCWIGFWKREKLNSGGQTGVKRKTLDAALDSLGLSGMDVVHQDWGKLVLKLDNIKSFSFKATYRYKNTYNL